MSHFTATNPFAILAESGESDPSNSTDTTNAATITTSPASPSPSSNSPSQPLASQPSTSQSSNSLPQPSALQPSALDLNPSFDLSLPRVFSSWADETQDEIDRLEAAAVSARETGLVNGAHHDQHINGLHPAAVGLHPVEIGYAFHFPPLPPPHTPYANDQDGGERYYESDEDGYYNEEEGVYYENGYYGEEDGEDEYYGGEVTGDYHGEEDGYREGDESHFDGGEDIGDEGGNVNNGGEDIGNGGEDISNDGEEFGSARAQIGSEHEDISGEISDWNFSDEENEEHEEDERPELQITVPLVVHIEELLEETEDLQDDEDGKPELQRPVSLVEHIEDLPEKNEGPQDEKDDKPELQLAASLVEHVEELPEIQGLENDEITQGTQIPEQTEEVSQNGETTHGVHIIEDTEEDCSLGTPPEAEDEMGEPDIVGMHASVRLSSKDMVKEEVSPPLSASSATDPIAIQQDTYSHPDPITLDMTGTINIDALPEVAMEETEPDTPYVDPWDEWIARTPAVFPLPLLPAARVVSCPTTITKDDAIKPTTEGFDEVAKILEDLQPMSPKRSNRTNAQPRESKERAAATAEAITTPLEQPLTTTHIAEDLPVKPKPAPIVEPKCGKHSRRRRREKRKAGKGGRQPANEEDLDVFQDSVKTVDHVAKSIAAPARSVLSIRFRGYNVPWFAALAALMASLCALVVVLFYLEML